MDVVAKEGSLFLQGVKFGKRIWRKTWVILFEPTPMGIGRIEMYDMRDGGGGTHAKPTGIKKADRRVVRLVDCLSITPAPGESCPTGCAAFYLNTTQRTYTLANLMQDEWLPTLCQLAFQRSEGGGDSRRPQKEDDTSMSENDLYSTWSPGKFQVTVQTSEASVRCCMSGSYLLSPEKEALCLLDLRTGRTVFYWPYRFLRRFGQIKEGVTIEAGRRCQTGEGQFAFLSKQGTQIYRAIEEAIMHQSVQDLLSKVTADLQEPTTQQPPVRPVVSDLAKGAQGSPTRGTHDRPIPVPSRRNLALPAPPVPTPPAPPAPPVPPAIIKHSAIVPKRVVVKTKPPLSTSKPPTSVSNLPTSASNLPTSPSKPQTSASKPQTSASKLQTSASKPQTSANKLQTSASNLQTSASSQPTSACKPMTSNNKPMTNASTAEEVLYATIQPHPKPRVKPTPPKISQPPVAPTSSPPQPKQKWELPKEIIEHNSTSDEDLESDYCNWKQGSELSQNSPNIEEVYSIVVPLPKHRTKPNMESSQDQAETSYDSTTSSSSEMLVNFKQILSNVLFKDHQGITPPGSYGGSRNHIVDMDDMDYCEIQK